MNISTSLLLLVLCLASCTVAWPQVRREIPPESSLHVSLPRLLRFRDDGKRKEELAETQWCGREALALVGRDIRALSGYRTPFWSQCAVPFDARALWVSCSVSFDDDVPAGWERPGVCSAAAPLLPDLAAMNVLEFAVFADWSAGALEQYKLRLQPKTTPSATASDTTTRTMTRSATLEEETVTRTLVVVAETDRKAHV